MRAYLHVRRLVLGRQLAEVGWVRLLLLGAFLVLALGKLTELLLANPALQWAGPVLGLLTAWAGHQRRTDLNFLRMAAPDFRQWLAAEYVLELLPVWGILLGCGYFGGAAATVAAGALVPWLPMWQARATQRQRRSLLRSEAFEWVSGFRQTGAWLLWLAGLGAAVWQHATVVPAVALGGWSLLVTCFYTTPEPIPMLTIYGRSVGAFCGRKLALALGLYLATAAPFFLLMATGPAGWGGAIGLLLWGIIVLIMSVLGKYAFYPQPVLVRLTQGGVVTVALLPLFSAPYAPLLAAAFVGILWKSHQRLKLYWNAQGQ